MVASLPIAADIQNDEVIGLKISREHGVGYVLSKYGNIFIFDVLSKKGIFFSRMDVDEVFATVMDSLTEGIMFVARTGLVYTVSLNPAECSNYVVARMNDRELANDLWKRLGRTVTTDEELPRAGTGHENRSSNLSEEEVLAINTARNSGKDNPSKRNSKERDSKEMSEQVWNRHCFNFKLIDHDFLRLIVNTAAVAVVIVVVEIYPDTWR